MKMIPYSDQTDMDSNINKVCSVTGNLNQFMWWILKIWFHFIRNLNAAAPLFTAAGALLFLFF